MPTPIENLVNFVQQRRAAMGLGHNALARAAGLDPGTLANLMVGRIKKAPSLATLQRIASGLQCDQQLLIAIVSADIQDISGLAEVPDGWVARAANRLSAPTRGDHPLTPDEIGTLQLARRHGLHWELAHIPEFLDIPPSDRAWMFQEFEGVVHAVEIHKRLASLDRKR